MALQKYEILISGEWYKVRGSTSGLKDGWLEWKDNEGAQGLARPGTWRALAPKKGAVKTDVK